MRETSDVSHQPQLNGVQHCGTLSASIPSSSVDGGRGSGWSTVAEQHRSPTRERRRLGCVRRYMGDGDSDLSCPAYGDLKTAADITLLLRKLGAPASHSRAHGETVGCSRKERQYAGGLRWQPTDRLPWPPGRRTSVEQAPRPHTSLRPAPLLPRPHHARTSSGMGKINV